MRPFFSLFLSFFLSFVPFRRFALPRFFERVLVDGERQRSAQSAEAVRFERERERSFCPSFFSFCRRERFIIYLYKEYIHIAQK